MPAHGILAVHAHPDDESIWTGLLLAKARRLGQEVTNVTCTLGEEGKSSGKSTHVSLLNLSALVVLDCWVATASRSCSACEFWVLAMVRCCSEGLDDGEIPAWPVLLPSSIHEPSLPKTARQTSHFRLISWWPSSGSTPRGYRDLRSKWGYGHPDHIRAHHITHAAVEELRGTEWEPRQVLCSRYGSRASNAGSRRCGSARRMADANGRRCSWGGHTGESSKS